MFLLLFAMLATWALTTPLMAVPDEPSHVIKAAAVARGQLGGELGPPPADTSEPGAPTWVQVPSDIADLDDYPNCFRFEGEQAADCTRPLDDRRAELEQVGTYAGQYPPLYYALVGWVSTLLQQETAVYAMRLVSAALCAFFLTWGVRRMAQIAPRRAVWGVGVALTPMCLFIMGSVNPNGLEIAVALSFWSACLALARRRSDADVSVPPPTSWFVQAVVSGAILVNLRSSGPLWALIALATAVVAARPGAVAALARSRALWLSAAAAAAAAVTAIAWVVSHDNIVTTRDLFPEYGEPKLVVAVVLLSTATLVEQMIGNFGWLDTPSPYLTVLAWNTAACSLVLLALAQRGARRPRAAVLLLLVAVLIVPVALSVPTAEAAGIVWQGRYTLPIAVGLPLLASVLTTSLRGETVWLVDRMLTLAVTLLGLGHVAAFYWASRRYAEGLGGRWSALAPEWESPLGFLPAVALYAALVAVAIVVAVRRMRATSPLRAAVSPDDVEELVTAA
ncbi:DUF2142 domain-containing protein [Cellulomonas sp.]|uniref:DUF2142 domain-containing protein n=1 Tax=Cellulomonas sp. TaxID=40001 RepID=UPI001B28B1E3|nr:DUF2142 domain-containing protein [Cellulomonas sp.]MBO9556692.1 DUF2142 domain-containing protein [Cellulomonas sp.]